MGLIFFLLDVQMISKQLEGKVKVKVKANMKNASAEENEQKDCPLRKPKIRSNFGPDSWQYHITPYI